uniref:Uncharacterized protein n=1 Tax=Arundo donax TaxID=35708 RepID=A0A0A8XPT5_ARUDO
MLLAAADASPAFRPDHSLTSLLATSLAASRRLPSLRRLLSPPVPLRRRVHLRMPRPPPYLSQGHHRLRRLR